jgi:hypothetical protein
MNDFCFGVENHPGGICVRQDHQNLPYIQKLFFFFITPRGWPMWWRPWSKKILIFFRKFENISWILDAEREVQILELDPICRRG